MAGIAFPNPFQQFTVPITLLRFSAGFLYQGQTFSGSYMTFPDPILAGQTISATINGIVVSVPYTTSSSATLTAFADAITSTVSSTAYTFVDNNVVGIVAKWLSITTISALSVSGASNQPTYTNNPTSSQIYACIQPIIGEELLTIPEGRRDQETYKLWSTVPIYTVNNSTYTQPDQLQFYGKTYEVYEVKPWQSVPACSILYQYNYYASRLQPLTT